MITYVAGFLFTGGFSHVALVQKLRPAWMQGKWNAVGGHTEPDETSHQAMVREFTEETNLLISQWKLFAQLSGHNDGGWTVDFYWAMCPPSLENYLMSPTDEPVAWHTLGDLFGRGGPPIMHNLRWLIPMAINDASGYDACTLFSIEEKCRR